MNEHTLSEKKARCEDIIRSAGRVLVAYSGGVDSTLVAKLAFHWLGPNAAAATAVSPSLAKADLDEAVAVARAIGIPHHPIRSSETDLPAYRQNSPQRCYFCKSTAYDLFAEFARTLKFDCVMDGTNADDTGEHRPGRRAAREHGVRSPLQEAGITKAEVRAWAAELGLSNWDKPSNACLSSRVPYGMEVNPLKLSQIETAESGLHALGFRQCRVRHHGQVARIEVEPSELPRALAQREDLVRAVKAAGFLYVTLDLEGFRSGSLNEALPPIPTHVS